MFRLRKHLPSTGFAALVLAMAMCSAVSVYGFDPYQVGAPGHYFDDEHEGYIPNLRSLVQAEPWRLHVALHTVGLTPAISVTLSETPTGKATVEMAQPGAFRQMVLRDYTKPRWHPMRAEREILRVWIAAGCCRFNA
jgi:hypothetical protein